MFKNFTRTDVLILLLAFVSLIFSELLWFRGEWQEALFIGLWVPSILAFGIYLKVMKIAKK